MGSRFVYLTMGISRSERAEDVALLRGFALGNAEVSTAFIRRFQGAVYGLAVSITRDPRLAEDVSQDVFLKAWRASTGYDSRRASVLTWLLTITRNTAIDAVRARRGTPTDDLRLEHLVQETLSGDDYVEEHALHRVESHRAVKLLHSVSPEQARAVVLAVIFGCTAAEVAGHEQIPLGTAKTRIRSGLRRLRQMTKVNDD